MFPNNNPQWAPSRTLIVSDPSKLSYFARANAIRMGVSGSAGTFQGATVAIEPARGFGNVVTQEYDPGTGGYNPTANSSTVQTPSGGQSSESFLDRLGVAVGAGISNFLPGRANAASYPPPVEDSNFLGIPPAVWGIGGIAAVGAAIYFATRK